MTLLDLTHGPMIGATWLSLLEPGTDGPHLVQLTGLPETPAHPPASASDAGTSHDRRTGAGVDSCSSTNSSDVDSSAVSNAVNQFGTRIDGWRRQSGIPRPSSCARASIAAAIACRPLLAQACLDPARLAIVSASTTSASAAAVGFETRGLREGWNAVDPLLLPSTLPNALASQVAMALGARGFALACLVGLLGVFHAIEAAALGLARGDADAALVVAAEEQTEVQERAHAALDGMALGGEFAGALVLERGAAQGLRLCFIGYGMDGDRIVPAAWRDAPRHHAQALHSPPSMQSSRAFRVLARALLAGQLGSHSRVVVTGAAPGLGQACIGFERVT